MIQSQLIDLVPDARLFQIGQPTVSSRFQSRLTLDFEVMKYNFNLMNYDLMIDQSTYV